ncbi:MAG: enoyl-CoA hydratase-related protein [Acidimicrobiales bacterium]
MSDGADDLVLERQGPVLVVRLNRPEVRNALSWSMIGRIGEAVAEAESDPAIRVIVLTGTGDRSFCSGIDLRSFAEGSRAAADGTMDGYMRLVAGQVTVPVIGAANATAVAAGFELLLGCDVVVASSEASFGLPEVKRGLFAGSGVMHVARRLPLGVALELTLTGDPIDATRAHLLGLVNAVVAPDQVLDTALAFAERIAANAPLSVAASKELVRMAAYGAPGADDRLHELQAHVFASEDAAEGATAFVEKRPPVWKGR